MRIKMMGSIKEATSNTGKTEDFDGNEMILSSLSPPSDFMFPNELNSHLRLQVNSLTAENGALRRTLREKELALEEMAAASSAGGECLPRGPLTSHCSAFGVGRASELAASKIVELSKRVRELTAELEAEKSRGRAKRAAEDSGGDGDEGITKRGQRKGLSKKQDTTSDLQEEDREIADQLEIKTLREKLSATNLKLSEWRNQCQALKQELKLADKILASEVGDGTTLEAIKSSMASGSPSGSGGAPWRGRAQQLTLLKAKMTELQEKLKNADAWSQGDLTSQCDTCRTESTKKDRERRAAEIERLETSLAEAERQAEEWKRKLEVSKARSAAKQAEIEALKSRLSTVLAKAEHDDQLITSLNECLKNKESIIRDKESDLKAMVEEKKKEMEYLNIQLMKEQAKVNNLEDALNKKNQTVEKLQEALQEITGATDLKGTNPIINAALTSRLSQSSEYELRATTQAAEAEKLRLMELVAVLNKRLKEEQSQTDQALRQMKIEKRKNALLETKISYLELESTPGRNNSYRKNSFRKNSSDRSKPAVPDDIKHRLEFLEEEKIVLESRIECLNQEKEEDLKYYSGLLRETRELFQAQLQELNCDAECNHESMAS